MFTSFIPLGLYQGVTENITLSRTPHHYLNVLSLHVADHLVRLPRPQGCAGQSAGPLTGQDAAWFRRPVRR
ncbi:hypothetical protein AB0M71_11860 [Amycolatopsis sp. NPDC051114]|uniref:hypothetical protein n=1 Tax=Amycolatopsis sp. NPDC051114 TaxID=3155280 RepID=UPI00341F0010